MAIERPPLLPQPINRRLSRLRFTLRRLTAGRRALPDALILGAAKAGTTSLFRYLEAQPAVRTGSRKEVHFFDFHFQDGLDWYQAHFPLRRNIAAGDVLLEGTPFYLMHPAAPARVAATLPDGRFLVLLRDPVQRAWSHYHAWHRRGRDPRGFAQAVEQEIEALDSGDSWTAMVERRLAGEDVSADAENRYPAYVERSLYGSQLQRWFDRFPRDRFWIEASESMFTDPAATVASACRFLGLPAPTTTEYPAHNTGRYREGPPADAVAILQAYLVADAARLGRLLGHRPPWPGA